MNWNFKTASKYRGRYREGWEALRQSRYQRLVDLGIVSEDWALAPHDNARWSSLTPEQRDDLDFKMALFAAIVDRLDQNIGRLVAHLEAIGELDNTLIVFVSDNGGTRETGLFGIQGANHTVDNYPEWARLGGWSSSYGQGWAGLSNAPFRRYKRENHEGGVSAPFVVHWPDGIPSDSGAGDGAGRLDHTPAHLIDLMPTFVEVAQARYPSHFRRHTIQAMEGESLVPLFQPQTLPPPELIDRTFFWEHEGNRAIRSRRWKLVGQRNRDWELYHIAADRTELNDLSQARPELFRTLRDRWDAWAQQVGVLSPSEFERARRAWRQKQNP